MDSMGKAVIVIHVIEKIGFDIEYRSEFLCPLQKFPWQGRLPNNETCLRDIFFKHFRNGWTFTFDHCVGATQVRLIFCSKNELQGPWLRHGNYDWA
jgi:hypothetical protein